MTYQTLQNEINELKIDFTSESEIDALNELHNQFNLLSASNLDEDEISDMVKGEFDVLTHFDQDTYFYESIRNIQDSMINFFS